MTKDRLNQKNEAEQHFGSNYGYYFTKMGNKWYKQPSLDFINRLYKRMVN